MRKLNIFSEWKSMGFNAYLPLLASIFLIIVVIINQGDLADSMPVIELIFPLFGCWWSIFILHDLLSESGSEMLFSLPTRRVQYGLLKVITFYLLYVILLTLMLLIMSFWIGKDPLISLALQLAVQSFFFTGLGFIAMVITRSTGWSLIIVISYLSLELLTTNNSIEIIDIYLHNVTYVPIHLMGAYIFKVMVLGALLLINAQYVLSTTTRYK